MLDEVAGRVFMGNDPPRFMVTAKMTVRYKRPVPVGRKLTLRGRAIQDKGRVAIAEGTIYDSEGSILAEAEVVLANIPDDMASGVEMSGEDWRVYPDEEPR
jgi:acyl-coenzyme A thioesterase PaaI-like protein